MNIVLFVSSILMILSLMTYARIDRFRSFRGMEAQFERYMSTVERSYINTVANQWYLSTSAPKGTTNANKGGGGGSKDAAARLSFKIFVDEKMREKDPRAYDVTLRWAKNLIFALYGKERFFNVASNEHPGFLDRIFEELGPAAKELPEKYKLTKAIDLSNLALSPDVIEVFYHMLKGCPIVDEKEEALKTTLKVQEDEGNDNDSDSSEEGQEYIKQGYDSLLNHITLRNTTKIRVYLASHKLLEAIFGSPMVADNIISARRDLYLGLKNETLTNQDATHQFKSMFQGYISGDDDEYLDFNVSLTNPANYE